MQEPSKTPTPPERPGDDLVEQHDSGLFGGRYPEVTWPALLFGLLLGAVMNAAITYAGLKIGFTIVGSAIAAVLGFGVLRGLLRRGSIVEVNITQTVASAVNTPNSGVIFTVPVLFLLGWQLSTSDLEFWLIMLACVAGAILGGAFIIPLRKQMIDIDRLRFPSPTGVALILKSPGAGAAKSVLLVIGMLVSALIYLPIGLTELGVRGAGYQDLDLRMAVAAEHGEPREITVELPHELPELEWKRVWRDEAGESLLPDSIDRDRDGQPDRRFLFGQRRVPAELGPGERVATPESRAAREAAEAAAETEPPPTRVERVWKDLEPGERVSEEKFKEAVSLLPVEVDREGDGLPDLLLTKNRLDVGRIVGMPDQFRVIFAIAPFAVGAGFLSGKAGLLVLAGGLLAFFVLNPLGYWLVWVPPGTFAHEAPVVLFDSVNRPLGIGLLLGGALMGILAALPAIRAALGSIAHAGKTKLGADELGFKVLFAAVGSAIVLLFLAADFLGNEPFNTKCPVTVESVEPDAAPEEPEEPEEAAEGEQAEESEEDAAPAVIHAPVDENVPIARFDGYAVGFASDAARAEWLEQWDDERRRGFLATLNAKPGLLAGLSPHLRALILAMIGAAWIWFAGIIIAQCSGMTDWSPISGMSLLTVVLVLALAGSGAVLSAVLIGAALCVAITCASDMMGDLKTGHLVGSKPKRQQTVELIATGLGPIITLFVILVIAQVNLNTVGVAFGPGTETTAPQAQALQAVITGVQGGEMPYALYGFGALTGMLLGLGSFAGLGVLVGLSMFLPFFYIATYGIGCVANIVLTRIKGARWCEDWGVPVAAGLIVGEALLALVVNFIVLAKG